MVTRDFKLLIDHSLKNKLCLVVSFLLFSTVLVATMVNNNRLKQYAHKNLAMQQFTLVSALADSLDDKLQIALNGLAANSRNIPPAALQGDVNAAQRYLDRSHGLLSLVDELFLLSAEGYQIAESPPQGRYQSLDFSYRQYFKRILATKAPLVSDPFRSEPEGRPSIVLAVPVMNRHDQIVAVLVGTLHLLQDNFLAKLTRKRIGKSGYLSLFNKSGTFIIHPDKDRILTQDIPSTSNSAFDRVLAGFEGTLNTYNSRGQPSLSTFKQLTTADWVVGISLPLDEAYSHIQKARNYVLISLIPLIILALLIAWWSMHYFLKPLKQLTNHVSEISGNSLTVEMFADYNNDEVGRLARTFNNLMCRLKKQHEQLVLAKTRAETEQAKSEAIIASIGDALTIRGTDFKILYQNRVAVDLFRNEVGTVCNKTRFNQDQPCSECALALTLQDGRTHIVEKVLTLGSEQTHIELTTSPIRDAEGMIVAGVEIARDISERKRMEDVMRESEEYYRQLFERNKIVALLIDPLDGQIVDANQAAESYYGYSIECLKSLKITDINCHPADEVATEMNQAKRDQHNTFYFRHRLASGEIREVEVNTGPMDIGKRQVLFSFINDVTERKRSEERIRKLSQAAEQSPAEIVITDLDGRIEYVNPCFCKVSGYAVEEVIGQQTSSLQVDELARQQEQRVWETVVDWGEWKGELQRQRKNGELYWVRGSVSPIRDGNGNITHFLGIGEDITERKQLEGQLRHAQKMEAVGQLAAGVAHDFNNILTAIIGYVGIQKLRAEPDSELMSDLNLISASADRGAKLIRDLLAFSREESTRFEEVDLNTIIQQALNPLRQLISSQIELKATLTPSALPVMVDSANFERVLLNLASNSSDAILKRGWLTITTERVSLDQGFAAANGYGQPGDYALLCFSDSGCGMDQETVKRIFEPFFTTKEVDKGTGMGLASSYSIIKQNQGYILCDSAPGKGTVFRIYIPLRPLTSELNFEVNAQQNIDNKEGLTSEPC